MEIGKTYTRYGEDGSTSDFIWTEEMDQRRREDDDLRFIEMNDEIRHHLKLYIDHLNKTERPRRNKDEMWFLESEILEIEDIMDTENDHVIPYNAVVQHVVLKNDIDIEVFRSGNEPYKFKDPRTGKKLQTQTT